MGPQDHRHGVVRDPGPLPVPGDVAGRPDRDRSRETAGAHRGAGEARTVEAPAGRPPSSATTSARTAASPPRPALHLGHLRPGRPRGPSRGDVDQPRARHPRRRPPRRRSGVLRGAGMDERQVSQAGDGRVPAGYQMERVPASAAAPSHYQLTRRRRSPSATATPSTTSSARRRAAASR
ncbi:hypothetical protein G7085_15615 [Tessaracoccus sp. HDW20]|uniref:hypothetical protein n=1 Tax=Tessaracoccus coleopterorum TaxID=2714950 RepID=UPI0018D3BDBC|nr:hypothetical protein [Tessaracoccus coleopterorum]NHB85554.1 hypothetical protein [Tessaracoccus coleopterorum]